jgi:hypothetical protein
MTTVMIETPAGLRSAVLLIGTRQTDPATRLHEILALSEAISTLAAAAGEYTTASVASTAARLTGELMEMMDQALPAEHGEMLARLVQQIAEGKS